MIDFNESSQPDTLAIVNMAKGAQDTRMRSALRVTKLLRSERRAGVKHFSGCPDRIAYVSAKQEPEFRHNGIVVVSPAAPSIRDFGPEIVYKGARFAQHCRETR